jgi:hypothetical protein
MILALARPPRATFGCLHAPPGALCRRNLRTAPTVQELNVAKPADGYGPRPAPVFAAPARPRTLRCIRSVHALTLSSVRSSPSLVRSFGRSYARALIRPFQHSLKSPIAHSLARSLFHMWLESFVHRSLGSLARFPFFYRSLARFGISAFARSLARSLVRSLVRSLIRSSFVRSCMARFVHSFARSILLPLLPSLFRSLAFAGKCSTNCPACRRLRTAACAGIRRPPRARLIRSFRAFIYHSCLHLSLVH